MIPTRRQSPLGDWLLSFCRLKLREASLKGRGALWMAGALAPGALGA